DLVDLGAAAGKQLLELLLLVGVEVELHGGALHQAAERAAKAAALPPQRLELLQLFGGQRLLDHFLIALARLPQLLALLVGHLTVRARLLLRCLQLRRRLLQRLLLLRGQVHPLDRFLDAWPAPPESVLLRGGELLLLLGTEDLLQLGGSALLRRARLLPLL